MAVDLHKPVGEQQGQQAAAGGRAQRVVERLRPHADRVRQSRDEQWARVRERVRAWYAAEDLDEAELVEKARRRKKEGHHRRDERIVSEVARLKTDLARAKARTRDDEHSYEVQRLTGELAAAEARVEIRTGDGHGGAGRVGEPGAGEVGRERWRHKATRVSATVAAAFGWLQVVGSAPGLTLLGTGAAAAGGWWYLAHDHEGQAAAVMASEGVGALDDVPSQDIAPAAVDAAEPREEVFVPEALAAAAKVSLVKRDSARVRGELDLITALVKAGIVTAAQRDETHVIGVIRPDGPGWTATVELPRGMKAESAVGKVADLASSLRIKKSRIEMKLDTSDEGHEGRFVLWVANEDNPHGTGKVASPLIDADRWDFWDQGVMLGTDARRVLHTMHLLWSSLLVGGLMGYGKTYLARLVAAAGALDPTLRIIVITGKTGPDWAPLRHVAHRWLAGAAPGDIRRALAAMETTIGEMQDRGTELDRLYEEDPDAVPEGKITRELAARGMGPVLLVVDELQELLDGGALVQVPVEDEEDLGEGNRRPKTRSGKDLMVESFARYVRVTRFVGGMGIFITQRPDASSVPSSLREVCAKRASFRVKGDRSARMVLGDDAVAAGAAPHLLSEDSRGVVVLDQGAEEGHITVKSHVIDLPDFKEICLRGRALREKAGTLTGDALDYGAKTATATAARTLLTDCLTVLDASGADRIRTERLVELLAEHESYQQLTTAQLQARLREAGAGTTRKLGRIDGMANPNGYYRDQLANANPGK